MNVVRDLRMLATGAANELVGLIRSHPVGAALLGFVVASGVAIHVTAGLSPVSAAYETLRLFIDSADASVDARVDRAPGWVVTLLWIDRFLAPAIVAGAVLEVVHRVSRHGAVRPWWRNHVIVVGAGGLGSALARHHVRRGRKVVVVEIDGDNPNLEGLRSLGITVVEGDIRQAHTLVRARVERAAQLFAVSGDDIANFSCLLRASRLTHRGAGIARLRAHALVADDELRARLYPLVAEQFQGTDVLFDAFGLAAYDLVHAPRILKTAGATCLVVAGYGKFGSAVVEEVLAVHGHRTDLHLWVVDPRLEEKSGGLKPSPGLAAFKAARPSQVHLEDKDMLDRDLWKRLTNSLGPDAHLDFAICTDNDARNVAFALAMRGETKGHCAAIQIIIRMLDWSQAEHDALPGIDVVSVTNLVIQGLNRG
ncbi:hypothetical protein LBMAG42_51570 [Deltaproteobacteria bacterium]|nr:hypothetical protein LBMAG42_51570 [Deltaproteobacteria bacterium]